MPVTRTIPKHSGTKKCRACGKVKDIQTEFYLQYRTLPVPRTRCIECVRSGRRRFYRENPEKEAFWDDRPRPESDAKLHDDIEKALARIAADAASMVRLHFPGNRAWCKLKPLKYEPEIHPVVAELLRAEFPDT